MYYPENLAKPMREELTSVGFKELLTPQDVDNVLNSKQGTTLVVVNSICGCAAAAARPAVKLALQNAKKPDTLTTVFAGMELEATARAREYFLPYPPSSPSIALFKDGELVHFVERHEIEGHTPQAIADNLITAFNKYC